MRPPLRCPQLRTFRCWDGYPLLVRLFPPPRPSRSAILYLHGIQSHGGWYAWSASLLAACGHAVVLPDRRGSGRNPRRGDVAAAERWLDDLDELGAWIRSSLDAAALDVVGASWGGKLAVAWLLARRPQVRRLLLIAPGIVPHVRLPLSRRVAIAACLMTGLGGRRFAIPLDDPALFTDNPTAQAQIRGDGLALHDATARFLHASWRLDRIIDQARPGALSIPAWLLLAGGDRIVDNAATRRRLVSLTAGRVRVAELSGAHSLEFASQPGPFARFLRDWATACDAEEADSLRHGKRRSD